MAGNITLCIIKPDAFANNYSGYILSRIADAGFCLAASKTLRLSIEQAKKFYEVHKEQPFYDGLVDFMTSGPVMITMLIKDNAVEDFRRLIGKTDPAQAAPGTLRADFGSSIRANAVHGSDSIENADRECNFFFSGCERFL